MPLSSVSATGIRLDVGRRVVDRGMPHVPVRAGGRGDSPRTGGIGFVWLTAWMIWFSSPEEATWLSEKERIENHRRARPQTSGRARRSNGRPTFADQLSQHVGRRTDSRLQRVYAIP